MSEQVKTTSRYQSPIFQARIRMGSGLILFIYVLSHYLNHALGLWSLSVMELGGEYFRLFWRFLPISIVLYTALTAHIYLTLQHLYKKRSLSMTGREWLQIALGLLIPLLMVVHLLATRMAHEVYALNDNYTYLVLATFIQSPISGIINVTGLVVVWVHGCIGLYAWMRLKPWFTGYWPSIALVLAALVPVLAINGFVAAGREIEWLAEDGEWLEEFYQNLNLTDNNLGNIVYDMALIFRYAFVGLLIAILSLRLVRSIRNRQNNQVTIDYLDGPKISHPAGTSLLEISRIHNIPHASVCGGRGRCSTCRVRILSSKQEQTPPDEGEQAVLNRVHAPDDVRLACQFVPKGDIRVIKLLPADATMGSLGSLSKQSSGVEQVVAVMFADIRGFTAQSEAKLPFDVVYLVNQFSRAMGDAIEESGGKVDKFLGDGLMALFGINTTPEEGCRTALKASKQMRLALDVLNTKLADDLDEPLRIGIGIHAGPVVLGEMGYGASRGLTAIGDTVNTASRLEAATKELGVSVCISAEVAIYAKIEFGENTKKQISLRGKKNKLPVHALTINELNAMAE